MSTLRPHRLLRHVGWLLVALLMVLAPVLHAEEDTAAQDETTEQSTDDNAPKEEAPKPRPHPTKSRKKNGKRRYMTDIPGRVDAGVFHVGFAAGGNLYIEPQISPTSGVANGDYFRDFGFNAGVYFDYNYNEGGSDIPLGLRGMVGYKYILSSVHVFTVDAVARRLFKLSENADFGLGGGVSAAVWYRAVTDSSPYSEVIFLPSLVVNAGFDFNPFMVDIKWLINRFGSDTTIMGWELYFGFRL